MRKPVVVDIHAHYFPETYLRVMEEEGPTFGVTLYRSDPAGPAIKVGAVLGGHRRREFYDLSARLKAMDRTGIRTQALSLTFPMVYGADAGLGARLARVINDAMSKAHTAYPERFVGLATSASLRYLIDLVGADRVMIGSDYCFDTGYERPVEVVTRLGRLSRTGQTRILGGNASRLLRLDSLLERRERRCRWPR